MITSDIIGVLVFDSSNIKITRSKRRTMSLQLLPDGTIVVKAPTLMPKFLINDFISKNHEWIEKQMNLVKSHRPTDRKYADGERFLYLGKEYNFKVGNYTSIKIDGDNLLFPKALLFRAKKEIENWYIRQAKIVITNQVQQHSEEMGANYISISFSDTKSKWGSCTHDNRLQFNWRLIMAPLLVLRYVVVHELAHTTHKNHSRRFWANVALINPSYKQQIKWLKTHGDTLTV